MAIILRVPRAAGSDLLQKLEQAKEAAAKSSHDINIEGDAERGVIEGVVSGAYRTSETAIVVSITKKPRMLSEKQIRKTVSAFFS